MDYLQIMNLIFSLDVDFHIQELLTFSMATDIVNPENILISLDCILYNLYDKKINVFFKKIFIIAMTVAAIPVIIAFFWIIYGCINKKLKTSQKVIKFFVTISITFFALQPSFTRSFLKGLICKQIEGKMFLLYYLSQECWTDAHLKLVFYIVLPLLLLFMIVIPFIFFIKIIRQAKSSTAFKGDAIFNFLVGSYTEKFYLWDYIFMAQ